MKIAIIVAMDRKRGIGKNNDLMWHLPADMQFFKETTQGHIVVMGRKNFDSIPKKYRPLPHRENVILTRNTSFNAEGCVVVHSIMECLTTYATENSRTLFIIGGGEIYKLALESDIVDEMYITYIDKSYDADTFFPEFDPSDWSAETIYTRAKDTAHEAGFEIIKYTRN